MQTLVDSFMAWLPDADPGTVQAFAAFLTLVTTLVLVELTRRSVSAATKAAQAANRSAQTAQDQLTHQEEIETLRKRPCVVLDFYRPAPFEQHRYVAHNAGPGPALNAWIVDDPNQPGFKIAPLGTLMSQQSVVLPDKYQRDLQAQEDRMDKTTFFVVCESVDGSAWCLSRNRVVADHRIVHEHESWAPTPEQKERLHPRTLDELLAVRYQYFEVQTNDEGADRP